MIICLSRQSFDHILNSAIQSCSKDIFESSYHLREMICCTTSFGSTESNRMVVPTSFPPEQIIKYCGKVHSFCNLILISVLNCNAIHLQK